MSNQICRKAFFLISKRYFTHSFSQTTWNNLSLRKLVYSKTNQQLIKIKYAKVKFFSLPSKFLYTFIGIPFITTVNALSFSKSTTKPVSKEDTKAQICAEADKLFDSNSIEALCDFLLPYSGEKDVEVLWRLGRALYKKAKITADDKEKKQHMYSAFEFVKSALELNSSNFACHKWYAILLDYIGEYEGTKQRLKNAFIIKEHFLKAIELNKTDATSVYLLGYWCFMFADLPWIQKKAASVIFTTPPTSSYDEALKYFLQAEMVEPNFYSMNLLMLGKTYLRLKETKLAVQYLKRAKNYTVVTEDDKQAHSEAIKLLKSLGVED